MEFVVASQKSTISKSDITYGINILLSLSVFDNDIKILIFTENHDK